MDKAKPQGVHGRHHGPREGHRPRLSSRSEPPGLTSHSPEGAPCSLAGLKPSSQNMDRSAPLTGPSTDRAGLEHISVRGHHCSRRCPLASHWPAQPMPSPASRGPATIKVGPADMRPGLLESGDRPTPQPLARTPVRPHSVATHPPLTLHRGLSPSWSSISRRCLDPHAGCCVDATPESQGPALREPQEAEKVGWAASTSGAHGSHAPALPGCQDPRAHQAGSCSRVPPRQHIQHSGYKGTAGHARPPHPTLLCTSTSSGWGDTRASRRSLLRMWL